MSKPLETRTPENGASESSNLPSLLLSTKTTPVAMGISGSVFLMSGWSIVGRSFLIGSLALSSGTGRVRRCSSVESGTRGLGGSTGKVCADPNLGKTKQASKAAIVTQAKRLARLTCTNEKFAEWVVFKAVVFRIMVGLPAFVSGRLDSIRVHWKVFVIMTFIGQNASLTDWIAPRANRIYDDRVKIEPV